MLEKLTKFQALESPFALIAIVPQNPIADACMD
jgi:hypothetical protein